MHQSTPGGHLGFQIPQQQVSILLQWSPKNTFYFTCLSGIRRYMWITKNTFFFIRPQNSPKKFLYQAPDVVVNPPKEIRGQDSATFQRLGMVAPQRSNLSEVSFSLCESDIRSSNTRERWPLWRAQLCRPRLRLLCQDMLSSPLPRYVKELAIWFA